MDGKSMKNKTLILVSGCIKLVYQIALFFQNWEHLGRRRITYLNATRHISVCLNIPIYSKTVSALLEWIMDGKSRCWVISYDTIRFCLSQYVPLWDWYHLMGTCWAGKQMSNPDLRNTTLHLIYRRRDPQRDITRKNRDHAENPVEPMSVFFWLNRCNRVISKRSKGEKKISW